MRKPAQNKGTDNTAPDDEERTDQADDLEERRRQLEAELASRRPEDKQGKDAEWAGKSSYAKAFQLSTEFVAAIFVGTLLGYLIDRFLGTTPWGMIIFLLLGFVAGVLNVMRSAGLVAENRLGPKDKEVNNHNADG
ncbi:AtpZ/AtpI family protein [Hoeflea prorocentri]|uniref:ATP synthase protein I n=1 Tax=Hoeflea prorocentri TaxID=1922333 RepID=A0A9X3UM59_9HYPH|nr:AtpZ/AtpI family protein [Hoeflea prorocentri]MCY6381724.1 AtpZ/AtpI family protein [Hoeflea prorocentri]MDA5399524.1 AtpZ/AtpI family protein [Hoeflea prorocentri]